MSLFGISKGLQFGVCNHGKPHASPHRTREKKRKLGGLLQTDVYICLHWDFPGNKVIKNLPCNAGGAGSITGQGTKVPHAMEYSQKKKDL